MVTCTYCSTSHPNPRCVRVGEEILFHGAGGLELTRVAKCDGPDAIGLDDDSVPRRLEDVIPVVRATASLQARTGVYCRKDAGWFFSFTASGPLDGQLNVKNENPAFQDTIFDIPATLDDLRLDARPPEAGGNSVHRTLVRTLTAQLRADPFGVLMKYGVGIFVAIIFTIVGVTLIKAFFFSSLRW